VVAVTKSLQENLVAFSVQSPRRRTLPPHRVFRLRSFLTTGFVSYQGSKTVVSPHPTVSSFTEERRAAAQWRAAGIENLRRARGAPRQVRSIVASYNSTAYYKMALALLLLALACSAEAEEYGSSDDYVACTTPSGATGDCMDATSCTQNGGSAYAGVCPGPANIQCCVGDNYGPCTTGGGQSGYCTGSDECIAKGNVPVPHDCPGPSDVQCCIAGGGGNKSVSEVVAFASATWNCDGGSPPCYGCARVPVGSAQVPYACAPWVAECLAAGGFVPGAASCGDMSEFSNIDGYSLNHVGCGTNGLVDWLQSVGWQATTTITAGTVCAVFSCEHAILGVGDGICAAHNNARWAVDCDSYYAPYDICLNPPPGATRDAVDRTLAAASAALRGKA